MFVLPCWRPIFCFNASFVYGDNSPTKCKALWDDIVSCNKPERLLCGFFWVTLMLFDPLMRRAVALSHGR